MEALHLSDFYQRVSQWPTGEADLEDIAEKTRQLLGAPFVALHLFDLTGKEKSRTGWKIDGLREALPADAVEAFVLQQIAQAQGLFAGLSGSAAHLKQIQLSREPFPARTPGAVNTLAIINLSGENRLALSELRGGHPRLDYGWLVIGTARALGAREECLALAAAQRLSSLAETVALEGAIQLRNQFLSIASHELKTPLTSIYGVLQLQERILRLKKDEDPVQGRERQESYLKMVIRQTQRLNELIDGLLDVSRIQNGRFTAEPTDTDVSALTRETLQGRLALIAQEAGVKLVMEIADSLRASVDPVRMEEVVTNLVMNAIRFSPEGGIVWVKQRTQGDYLHLIVRDQGPALPVEDRERIFQPFERAQRTARFGGLGLGLFISRQIARLHGGDVILSESVVGKGNVFEATFSQRTHGDLNASA